MTSLLKIATAHGASWIIPFDADECWMCEDDIEVADYLRASPHDLVYSTMYHYAPSTESLPGTDPAVMCMYTDLAAGL